MEDSILVASVIDAIHRVIADTCVTNNALIKSQELYNTSFVNMQNSFSTLVNMIIAALGVLSLFTGVVTYLNFKYGDNLKEKFKKIEKEFEKQKFEFEKVKGQFEEQKSEFERQKGEVGKEFEKITKKFEEQKKELERLESQTPPT